MRVASYTVGKSWGYASRNFSLEHFLACALAALLVCSWLAKHRPVRAADQPAEQGAPSDILELHLDGGGEPVRDTDIAEGLPDSATSPHTPCESTMP